MMANHINYYPTRKLTWQVRPSVAESVPVDFVQRFGLPAPGQKAAHRATGRTFTTVALAHLQSKGPRIDFK
jgi:hypothetical protein